MREYYCVCGRMERETYDVALGQWHVLGMQGCEESPCDNALVDVKVYFTTAKAATAAAHDLRMRTNRTDTVTVTPVADEDWNQRWRQSMKPAMLAPSWWVAPLWLPPPGANDHWIKIEPKTAFGTGHHETTRLAARTIIACIPSLASVRLLDIGTGSGVLCFVAARAGAARCVGIEIDRECRKNLTENRMLNGEEGGSSSFVIGPVEVFKEGVRFDLIVMNMIHTDSAPLLDTCRTLLAEKGVFIWSGILREENRRAIEAAEAAGFAFNGECTENEWWCGRFGVETQRASSL
ncbi:MAG: 50S ribosomal protein L11 methyltransferase [Chitinispirillaceae bacterium]|nr:50S ribosomal protein L11 methyltransferase [Chitinispirillaceae bacterium]